MKKVLLLILACFNTYVYADIKIKCSDLWKNHQVCQKKYYDHCYVNDLEQSEWAYYRLEKDETLDNVSRVDSFRSDPTIILKSATPNDYRNSGFDKGHILCCDDFRFCKEAMDETFLMSVMSPQTPSFNRHGAWRELEQLAEIYAIAYGYVEVISGPIVFNMNNMIYIGKSTKIVVPDAFFKVFYNKEMGCLEAYVIPQSNSNNELKKYKVDVTVVQMLTGLVFEFN